MVREEARASFYSHHFPGERIVSHYVVCEQEAVVRKSGRVGSSARDVTDETGI